MILEHRLKTEDIRQQTVKTLKENLSINVAGYRCDTSMIWDILLKASVERVSIEATCADLEGVADSNTVREHLNEALGVADLRLQEAEMNSALAASIPLDMGRVQVEVAIDFHDEPFYGKTAEVKAMTCRGQAKKGTTHFIRIASAYVMWRQVRLTLAVVYVLPDDKTLGILQRLLGRLKTLGFSAKVLYLDKGFASTRVIRYLTDSHQPAIIACPIRGKDKGTRSLCSGRSSYRTTYAFTDGTLANLAAVATLVPDKSGQRRRKWVLFIVIHLDWSPHKIYDEYRRRFGIECSYRLLRQVRASTTSPNPALRFFLLGIGLVLVNTWVFLRWEFARAPGPGPRRVEPDRFRFHRFVRLLVRGIEDIYGVISFIPTRQNPQSVIY
jgi:putative transposase